MTAPVLVVGAGPVGLVAGCELLRQGVDVRVVDSRTGSPPHSRAIVVWPRSLELLRSIGASAPLLAAGNRVDAIRYFSERRLLGSIELSRLADTPYPYGITIPQVRTEAVLLRRLEELGGAVETGVALVGLQPDASGVTTRLRHPDGTVEETRHGWLVGADGASSATRDLLGIPFDPVGGEVRFAIADAAVDGDLTSTDMLYSYRGGGALGLAPLGEQVFRIAFAVPAGTEGPLPRAAFQQRIDALSPVPGTVGALRWSTVFRARRRLAGRFVAGRCLLAGDAAHIFSAAGAQGMNTGIQDAVNLAWRLGGVVRGELDPQVLPGYEAERRPEADRVSLATARQTSWGLYRRRTSVAARDLVVRGAAASGLLQRAGAGLMSQTDVSYGARRRVRRPGRSGSLRVGDRLPVFADGGPNDADARGWPVLPPDGALALWAGGRRDLNWETLVSAIRTAVGDMLPVVDVSGFGVLAPLLGGSPRLVAVRPDGHVAGLHPPRAVDDALAALRRRRAPVPVPVEGGVR